MSRADELARGIAQLDLNLAPEVQEKLLTYLALLQKWNKVYNLTAIRDPQQMVSHHLLDSLAVLPHLWPRRWPDWSFAMLDSNSKKTSFVQQAAIEMGLKNVSVHCARVEEFSPAQPFDGIISRAFAEAADFVALTRHLLTPGARWAAMKGAPEPELARLPSGVAVESNIPLRVPGLDAARSLVILRAE
jgi:16S rRNA (guanine527-N7)-methyltransferase